MTFVPGPSTEEEARRWRSTCGSLVTLRRNTSICLGYHSVSCMRCHMAATRSSMACCSPFYTMDLVLVCIFSLRIDIGIDLNLLCSIAEYGVIRMVQRLSMGFLMCRRIVFQTRSPSALIRNYFLDSIWSFPIWRQLPKLIISRPSRKNCLPNKISNLK
jgi:hypothetical protein